MVAQASKFRFDHVDRIDDFEGVISVVNSGEDGAQWLQDRFEACGTRMAHAVAVADLAGA